MIEIMNLRSTKPTKYYDVCIDRSSPLGNPFFMKGEAQREEVCISYEIWFHDRLTRNDDAQFALEIHHLLSLYRKHGKLRLFCWCAPKQCHGETIKKYIEESV